MALSKEEKENNKKVRKFKTRVKKTIRENGVKIAEYTLEELNKGTGCLILNYGLDRETCIDMLKYEIENYHKNIPKNKYTLTQTVIT